MCDGGRAGQQGATGGGGGQQGNRAIRIQLEYKVLIGLTRFGRGLIGLTGLPAVGNVGLKEGR